MHLIEAIVREPSEFPTNMNMEKDPNSEPSSPIDHESLETASSSAPLISDEPVPDSNTERNLNEEEEEEEVAGIDALDSEELAVSNAIASANASYVPPAAVLLDPAPEPLLASIDGPSLSFYDHNPSTYTARNIPVAVRSKLTVPIYVTNSGSIVEYALESKYYDVGFGIVAEREDGITTVVELERVDSHVAPITGRFLVITVPCALIFTFDNEYSWFREKNISYRITITPPNLKHLVDARRVRANIALQHVMDDKQAAEKRLEQVASKRSSLLEEIKVLEREVAGKRETLNTVTNEEEWLLQRVTLRRIQEEEIQKRLVHDRTEESIYTTESQTCEI